MICKPSGVRGMSPLHYHWCDPRTCLQHCSFYIDVWIQRKLYELPGYVSESDQITQMLTMVKWARNISTTIWIVKTLFYDCHFAPATVLYSAYCHCLVPCTTTSQLQWTGIYREIYTTCFFYRICLWKTFLCAQHNPVTRVHVASTYFGTPAGVLNGLQQSSDKSSCRSKSFKQA